VVDRQLDFALHQADDRIGFPVKQQDSQADEAMRIFFSWYKIIGSALPDWPLPYQMKGTFDVRA
jgi:hypothetical protein